MNQNHSALVNSLQHLLKSSMFVKYLRAVCVSAKGLPRENLPRPWLFAIFVALREILTTETQSARRNTEFSQGHP
jgi:hypothetical protein